MASRDILTRICVLLILVHFSVGQHKLFDCRRPGVSCRTDRGQKGRCIKADGACDCPNTAFRGDDCGVEVANVKTTGCGVTCSSGGQCYSDGTVDTCRCDSEHYGAKCEKRRVEVVDCTDNSMRVNVNPLGDFKGKIYVNKLSLTPGCVFKAVPPTSDLSGYELLLNRSDVAGENACASSLTKTSNTSAYEIIVQYNTGYVTHTDEKHVVRCYDGGDVGMVGTVINSGGLDDVDLTGVTVTQTSLSVPINMQVIEESAGTPVASVVHIGDHLVLQVTMDTSIASDYVDFFVESCSAFNREFDSQGAGTPGDLMEKLLVLDRCPDSDSKDVISGDLSKSGGSISIPFRGFKFDGYDSLFMSCSVKLCRAADRDDCAPIACPGSSTPVGFGRRRRQAETEDNKFNVTRRVFVVAFGDDTVAGTSSRSRMVETESCTGNVAFVATAVVFGIALTVAFIIAIVLCVRSHRVQREKPGMAKA